MPEGILLKKAILHILDSSVDIPVLSGDEMELDGEISEFLEKHIEKAFEDNNLKNACFSDESNKVRSLCADVAGGSSGFAAASAELAGHIFGIMVKNVDIAPGDLICCMFEYYGRPYFGMLKLNYKAGFTHYVMQQDQGSMNTIIRHRTILPSDSQKVDECVFVDLEDFSIKLIEREYEIDGEKCFYLSKLLLNCTTDLSSNQKLKIIDKVTQKINKKYFDEDFEKVAKLKKVVSDKLEDNDAVRVDTIAGEVFESNYEVRDEYLAEIRKAGLTEEAISIPEKLAEKKFKTHKIKTDTGIEINFPLSYYDNRDMIEFQNNPDGTISILIKNVGKIVNK